MRIWKWFYPGIGIKRWIIALGGSFILIFLGLLHLIFHFTAHNLEVEAEGWIFRQVIAGSLSSGLVFMILGGVLFIFALNRLIGRINSRDEKAVDLLYRERILEKGPVITALGGGTGLSNLLRGLKKDTSNLNAVVTVADDGGSSGRLRRELGMPPPGDIRNCLVALADREPLMEDLFQYRFSQDGHLVGHSFGNLFIASLNQILGDFEAAVRESSRILAVRGQVLPAAAENVRLGAQYEDGSQVMGESDIPLAGKDIERVFLEPEECRATPASVRALEKADIIVVGPGSLYTSIIPNLLIYDIKETIKNTARPIIYICNLMTQPGETEGYNACDHVKAISNHTGEQLFDWIIVNRQPLPEDAARRYRQDGSYPVSYSENRLKEMGLKVRSAELLQRQDRSYVRHDPVRLAEIIQEIVDG